MRTYILYNKYYLYILTRTYNLSIILIYVCTIYITYICLYLRLNNRKHCLQTKRDGGESLGHSVWNYTYRYYKYVYTYNSSMYTRGRFRDKNRITYPRARIKRLLDFTATVDDFYSPYVGIKNNSLYIYITCINMRRDDDM